MTFAAGEPNTRVNNHTNADAAAPTAYSAEAAGDLQTRVDGDTDAVVAAGAGRTANHRARVGGQTYSFIAFRTVETMHASTGVDSDTDRVSSVRQAALISPTGDRRTRVARDTDGAAATHLAPLSGAALRQATRVRERLADARLLVAPGVRRTGRAGTDRARFAAASAVDNHAHEFGSAANQLARLRLNTGGYSALHGALESYLALEETADIHSRRCSGTDRPAALLYAYGAGSTIGSGAHVERPRELQAEHLVGADHAFRLHRALGSAAEVLECRGSAAHADRLVVLHLAAGVLRTGDQLTETQAPRLVIVHYTPLAIETFLEDTGILDENASGAVLLAHLTSVSASAYDLGARVCGGLHRIQHAHGHPVADGAASTLRALDLGAGVDADGQASTHETLFVLTAHEASAGVNRLLAFDAHR